MTERIKHILIGLFVSGAIAIGAIMVLFLEPKIGDGKKLLKVRFANIAGIVVGTRVAFAGKPVGEVLHIKEIDDARMHPDELGRVYFYELTLKTDSCVEIYDTDEIAVRSIGLMGEKSVAILPKAGKNAKLITHDIIYANSNDPLENTFNQITKTAARIEGAVGILDDWFQENRSNIIQTILSFDQTLCSMHRILSELENNNFASTLSHSAIVLNDTLEALRSSLVDEKLLQKIAFIADDVDEAIRSFNVDGAAALKSLSQVAHDLSLGKGTVGRLLARDDFYLRFSSLMGKAETLMNDINHYGILFQYDKSWQRTRTKKANLLKSLDTPRDFRAYFNGEIDSITTSLGRLSELLERAENGSQKAKIYENELFKKQFAELLRSAESLTDAIKLYNQNLRDDELSQ